MGFWALHFPINVQLHLGVSLHPGLTFGQNASQAVCSLKRLVWSAMRWRTCAKTGPSYATRHVWFCWHSSHSRAFSSQAAAQCLIFGPWTPICGGFQPGLGRFPWGLHPRGTAYTAYSSQPTDRGTPVLALLVASTPQGSPVTTACSARGT